MHNQPVRSSSPPVESFMAAPAPTSGPPSGDGPQADAPLREATHKFYGVLREMRAEVQNLQTELQAVDESSKLEDASVRATQIKAALQSAEGVLGQNKERINSLLQNVRQIFQQHASIYDWCSDEVTHIENCWQRMGDCWPETDQPEDEVVRRAATANSLLDRMIYLCGQMTIPARVNQHLQFLRIGQTLDFHKNFKDEMTNDGDRQRLLAYMADHPYEILGVVDAKNGVVYRAAREQWRRWLSPVMLLAALIAGVGLIFVLTKLDTWLSFGDWPLSNRFPELAVAYIFLTAGALAHLLVNALKQFRENKGAGLVAVEDGFLWMHVKENMLLLAVVYIWIGLLGLAFTAKQITWPTAFFVGYSLDSFVDLFLQRFSQVVSSHTKALQEKPS